MCLSGTHCTQWTFRSTRSALTTDYSIYFYQLKDHMSREWSGRKRSSKFYIFKWWFVGPQTNSSSDTHMMRALCMHAVALPVRIRRAILNLNKNRSCGIRASSPNFARRPLADNHNINRFRACTEVNRRQKKNCCIPRIFGILSQSITITLQLIQFVYNHFIAHYK